MFNQGYLPLNLDFHITKRCSLKCAHCYANLESLKNNQDYSLDEIKHIVDQAYAMGVRWIRLLGGEPLIRNDVGEIIRYIKLKKIFCELNTNAVLIPRKLEEIAPVDAICISIDGPREENDMIRGKGSFDQIMAGIEAAVGAGHTPRLHAVVTRHNLYTIEAMNLIASKYGLRFNYNHCALEEYPDASLNLTKEESREFCRKLLEAKKKGCRISNSAACIRLMSKWPFDFNVVSYDYVEMHPEVKKFLPECQMCNKAVYLDADGHVYACPRRWKKRDQHTRGRPRKGMEIHG